MFSIRFLQSTRPFVHRPPRELPLVPLPGVSFDDAERLVGDTRDLRWGATGLQKRVDRESAQTMR